MATIKKILWTDHARQRLQDRGLSKQLVEQAISYPDHIQSGKKSGTNEYRTEFDGHTVTAVTTTNDHNEILIISCWIDPPLEGTKDWHKKKRWRAYTTLPWWKKLLWLFLRQLGVWDF